MSDNPSTAPPSPAANPSQQITGNLFYDLLSKLGTAGLAVFVLMQVNSRMQEENKLAREAFTAEGKEMRTLFQSDSEKDRTLHRESLKLVGEQTLKQNDKTSAMMDRAIEEMKRATSAMEAGVKAMERIVPRSGGESQIRPFDPCPALPPTVSSRLVRTVAMLAVYCSVPLVDPPVKLGGHPSPRADPTPPPPPPPDKPVDPIPLEANRFRFLWVDDYKGDVPIRWKAIPLDDRGMLNLESVNSGDTVLSVIQGENDFKRHTVPKDKAGAVAIYGKSDGLVLLIADGVRDGQIVTLLSVRVKVGLGSKPPPPIVNPPDQPPVDKPTGSLFFVIVRPNGAITTDLEKVLADPEWEAHRKAGRSVKAYTVEELGDRYKLPSGTKLPCVLTLRVSADGKSSTIARDPIDLPTTSDGIRKLNEGVK